MRLSSLHRFFPVVMLMGLATTTGCARMARAAFKSPTVELKGVQVRGIGLQGGTLDVVLDVYNPNGYAFDVSRLTYAVMAESVQVATGEVTRRVKLAGKEVTTVTLPVTFGMKELNKAANVLLQRGSVEYTVQGEFTLATRFGSITRPYASKGRYDSLDR